MRCTGHNRAGEQCKRHATPGRTKCYFHGGASLAGIASPSLKHGKYSAYLPKGMKETYERALADEGRLLSLSDEVALIDGRLADLLQKVIRGEGAAWNKLDLCVKAYERAHHKGEKAEADYQLSRLTQIIDEGQSGAEVWTEIDRLLERRRKMATSEQKLRMDKGQLIPVETVQLILKTVLTSVRDHVKDPEALRRIAEEYSRLGHQFTARDDQLIEGRARLVSGESN